MAKGHHAERIATKLRQKQEIRVIAISFKTLALWLLKAALAEQKESEVLATSHNLLQTNEVS